MLGSVFNTWAPKPIPVPIRHLPLSKTVGQNRSVTQNWPNFSFCNFIVVSGVYEDAESVSITYNTVITNILFSILRSHFNHSALEPILGQTLPLAVSKVNRMFAFLVSF